MKALLDREKSPELEEDEEGKAEFEISRKAMERIEAIHAENDRKAESPYYSEEDDEEEDDLFGRLNKKREAERERGPAKKEPEPEPEFEPESERPRRRSEKNASEENREGDLAYILDVLGSMPNLDEDEDDEDEYDKDKEYEEKKIEEDPYMKKERDIIIKERSADGYSVTRAPYEERVAAAERERAERLREENDALSARRERERENARREAEYSEERKAPEPARRRPPEDDEPPPKKGTVFGKRPNPAEEDDEPPPRKGTIFGNRRR